MALTITKNDASEFTMIMGSITFDSSYPTGGEALTADDLGVYRIVEIGIFNSEGGYVYAWDPSAGKIKAFEAGADAAALDEVGNGTDLSNEIVTFSALVIGEVGSDDF